MASGTPFYKVVLTEDDVPGAQIEINNISANNREALKRWLECRGLATTGKKEILEHRYV